MRHLKLLLLGAIISSSLGNATAQRLKQYITPSQKLIYIQNSASYLVPHTARSFENAMHFHKKLWNYTASEPTSILFNDFTDYGNGGTMVIPWNMLNISVAPFDYSFGVVPSSERMQWLMEHELAHQVMCDQAARSDIVFRKILGGKVLPQAESPLSMIYSYLTTPRWYSPRWYHEGIAVFMETWMSGGIGRTLGGYDEMVFRTMVHDSAYFYRPVGLQAEGTTIDFQVGVNAYLYGTRFVNYLAKNYGVKKLIDFYCRDEDSKRFFASQFKNVYKKKLGNAWEEWIAFEKGFQQKNLQGLRQYPVTKGRPLTEKAMGSTGRAYYLPEENAIYLPVNYPGKMAHLARIDKNTGRMEKIGAVVAPKLYTVTSMAMDKASQKLYLSNKNSDWRGLEVIDSKNGRRKQLMRFTRTGDLVYNPHDKSIWGIQTNNGRTAIVRIPEPYKEIETLYTLEYTISIFNLDISPDGKFLSASLSEVDGMEKLVLFDIQALLNGQRIYTVLFDFEESGCADFVFDQKSEYLYGSSYFTGVSNIFRINIDNGQMECLTNAETGYFRPLPLSEDSLLAFRYTTEGMLPEVIAIKPLEDVNNINYLGQETYEANPVLEEWMLPPLSELNMDSVTFRESAYHPFVELGLAHAYPIFQGYKDLMAWGYQLNFMDPLAIHRLQLQASYSPYSFLPEKERLHLSLKWNLWKWSVQAFWNKADFYDLAGPTKVSRKGYGLIASYHKYIRYHKPLTIDFKISGAAYGGLDRMPDYQNVAASSSELYYLLGNFHLSHLRKSLGAVEPEQGIDWNVYASGAYDSKNIYPQVYTSLDAGLLLPFRNTSFWLRTAAGLSLDNTHENSFNNFYFGGFGNNIIDYQNISRYRDIESFPGLGINEAGGHKFVKTLAELNLKPLYFKKFGFTFLYVTYARLSLLGGGLYTTDLKNSTDNYYYNGGAQLDFDIVIFSLLKSTLSIGIARAWRPDNSYRDEFMLSLKLM